MPKECEVVTIAGFPNLLLESLRLHVMAQRSTPSLRRRSAVGHCELLSAIRPGIHAKPPRCLPASAHGDRHAKSRPAQRDRPASPSP